MNKSILILSLFLVSVFITGCASKDTSRYDSFATCLTEKGVIMYGTEWCPHCQNEKKMFGSSFQYINYIDCDKNQQACVDAGIEGYPTWLIDGKKYPGEQSFYDLATLSGCSIE